MSIEFDHPAWLAGLILAILPLVRPSQTMVPYSCTELIPDDLLSSAGDWLIRLIAGTTLAIIVLGLSGPHKKEQPIEKIGTGAHIVLLLDRSASMNQNFLGRRLGGRASESKGRYAQHLLAEFIKRRGNDLFAMASFSTSPIYTLALTRDREAILSALRAASLKGRGITNLSAGLSMALDFFSNQALTGSRVILLVSDGATRIDPDSREKLRQWFFEAKVSLYWIYLRNPNGTRLNERPKNPNEQTTPEYFLHQFFSSMEIPYQASEADNPESLKQAIREIEQLENKPILYFEKILRKDLSVYCYAIAATLLGILLAVKWIEIRTSRS
ncbi:MAG: vWA domain-containing protein [Methylococcales bacterium]